MTFVDDFLPTYDVSDAVAVVVDAGKATTWRALIEADLMAVGRRHPAVALLGGLRMLPELAVGVVRGAPLPKRPDRLTLRDTADPSSGAGGWVLLADDEAAG